MKKNFKNRYTVKTVPFYYKPIYWIYGYGIGFFVFVVLFIIRSTLKVKFIGRENLKESKNNIHCFWHQNLIGYYLTFPDHSNFDLINHPAWYMKPIHVLIKCYGVRNIFYGSTGNNGLEAAKALTKSLRAGHSTYITPDGPYGPLHKLNKGVLHLSKDSLVPIVPIKFEYRKYKKQKGWDRKRMPLPFSTITVYIGQPINVNESNFHEAESLIKRQLETE